MAKLMILRKIIPQPGRIPEAIKWMKEKEKDRQKHGQITQLLARSSTDPSEYLFIQVWESKDAYERWKNSDDRAALAKERQLLLAHDPVLFYEML
ncbi:MAG: antibiotic biosynthesis monooxygenase [Chloroflexi bacterium]|nr:antibiotic biosynthesis monooxygenase [Chloroflexota bacterium]MDA8189476.1 antibiotic biosynthesis monooxygenase [Dehalococcoidales bacterium]